MKFPEQYRIVTGKFWSSPGDQEGAFEIRSGSLSFWVIASSGMGWDHVSIHVRVGGKDRCPSWNEMCAIKDLFWDKCETVVQFHPKKSNYVNLHKHTLHLWKKQGQEFELPETIMV